jgi:hypothetical protein
MSQLTVPRPNPAVVRTGPDAVDHTGAQVDYTVTVLGATWVARHDVPGSALVLTTERNEHRWCLVSQPVDGRDDVLTWTLTSEIESGVTLADLSIPAAVECATTALLTR